MYYYLIVKEFNKEHKLYQEFFKTLNRYYGKVVKEELYDDCIIIHLKDEFNKENLNEYINTFFNENIFKGLIYISDNNDRYNNLDNEILLINKMINKVNEKYDDFSISKNRLYKEYFKFNVDNNIKELLLKETFNDEVMILTINTFLDNNLNSLVTSKKLNVHRNTLLYRLNKFYSITGLDPKNFNDAVIISTLL